jgi:hypothetical protein
MNATATARLITHAGGYVADEAAVRAQRAPDATATWKPIGHGTLLDLIGEDLARRGLEVENKSFALANSGSQMFATYTLRSNTRRDFALAMGIRNSTDKTLPAGVCAGSKVFVCDNLAFSAEVVFGRKHTKNIMDDLPGLVSDALNKFDLAYVKQDSLFEKWNNLTIDVPHATDLIVRMADEGHIPTHSIVRTRKEFISPRFNDFAGGTVWGLFNAATTILRHERKEINPFRNADQLLGIHKTLEAEFADAN